MSDVAAAPHPPAATSIDLAILNQTPISSAELGELFSALSKDYARTTRGRTLMVLELRSGSILATLVDAAAVIGPVFKDLASIAEAAGAMGKFSNKVFSALGRAKAGAGGVFEGGRRREGQASAEALLKIAADANAEVTIKQTAPDGNKMEIKVISKEAIQIREDAATARLMLEGRESRALLLSPGMKQLSTEHLAESVLSLTGPSGFLSSDAQQAIAVMVAALRDSGFDRSLTSLALALERRGRSDLAALVRDAS